MAENFARAIIAFKNKEEATELSEHLKSTGMESFIASDGSEVMENALSSKPSIIITDLELPEIDTMDVFRILLSNPNTTNVPFAFFMDAPAEIHGFRPKIDIVQMRPYILEDLYKKIRSSVVSAQSGGSGPGQEMTGSLVHMSLPDLLQILQVNKKEGMLTIKEGVKVGHILMKDGDIYSVTQGRYEGEKALYRLFAWERGTFEFTPKAIFSEQKLKTPTSGLLMEGMRNLDEFENHKEDWPSDTVPLKAVKTFEEVPPPEEGELKPAVKEIIRLMKFYPRLKDIIDNTTYTDLQIAENIMYLIDNEVIERVDGKDFDMMSIFDDSFGGSSDSNDDDGDLDLTAGAPEKEKKKSSSDDSEDEESIITPNEAIRLKEKFVSKWHDMLDVSYAKVFVLASSAKAMKDFLLNLNLVPGFRLNKKLVDNWDSQDLYMGKVAKLSLYGGLDLSFFTIPGANYSGPLIQVLSPHLAGMVIVCDDNDEKTKAINDAKKYINTVRPVCAMHVYTGEENETSKANQKLMGLVDFRDGDTMHVFKNGENRKNTEKALSTFLRKMIELYTKTD